ncbi:bifunctional diguanylate cyclase/phosphodiesterase [Actinoplanes sp. NPDC051470]|uniref:putative bifunctional diguanylate cyclase/phosphodiesterase n=1 Tax=unclassified Actinoplanes TaxID=2626549 RepID=UPI003414063E
MGLLAIGGWCLLADGLPQDIAYDVIGLASVGAIVAGIRIHRPERAAMWWWFAAGNFVWVLGDLTYEFYEHVLHQEPYPSLADAFYLSAYPMMVVGLLMLVRQRRTGAGLVDASIVATSLGLMLWIFVIQPIAADSDASTLERLIGVAYPAGDTMMLFLLAGLATNGRKGSPSSHLLGLATLLLLASDVTFAVLSLYSDQQPSVLDAGFLISYVCWAAAALHPSMRGSVAGEEPDVRMTRRRLVLLAITAVLAPGLLFVPSVGAEQLARWAVGACGIVLFLLVVGRMSGFVATVQRQSGQLADLAMRDDLTGLANRRRFEQAVREALAGGRPTVLLLDLNGFKEINDDLGHAVGDRLLAVLAGRLRNAVHPDSVVARMGGDEFAVLLPDARPGDLPVVVDRLAGTLHEAIRVGEHDLLASASIGSADGAGLDDPVEMLRRADVAMYAAKHEGAWHRAYEPGLDERAGAEARLGAELRAALDAEQFRLVFQPIVTLPEGRLAAVETLVRWEHPERGLVGPDDFVPVAERNGLIVELGAWILRTACLRAAGWRREHGPAAPPKISVNVSARQLAQPGFPDTVREALATSGLPASALAIEVTETAVFTGGRAVEALHQIRAQGVQVALDDFGTGHSSLGLLQSVPVDILKVDKSFIDNVTKAGRHAVIASSLIDIGNGLGLATVAEGVETAEQAAELHRLGYRLAQGYHFGRPVLDPMAPSRDAALTFAAVQ